MQFVKQDRKCPKSVTLLERSCKYSTQRTLVTSKHRKICTSGNQGSHSNEKIDINVTTRDNHDAKVTLVIKALINFRSSTSRTLVIFVPLWQNLNFFWRILVNSHIKLYGNPSSGSRTVSYGQTELMVAFRNLASTATSVFLKFKLKSVTSGEINKINIEQPQRYSQQFRVPAIAVSGFKEIHCYLL